MVALRTPVDIRGEDMTTVAEFAVGAGETIAFVLGYGLASAGSGTDRSGAGLARYRAILVAMVRPVHVSRPVA